MKSLDCETHLNVTSRVKEFKGIRIAIYLEYFFLINRQNAECSVTLFLYGTVSVCVFTCEWVVNEHY